MKLLSIFFCIIIPFNIIAQLNITVTEKTNFEETATYKECITFYENLDKQFSTISIKKFGETDAGYPLHLVLFSADKNFDNTTWHKQNKVVMLINNGIHPGEPDGIDASMMLLRDLATNKITAPKNVVIAIIPVYNVGGCLNRNSFSRVNQNGPNSYGFRGNAQNLDLNRDFTKCDSKEAKTFATIFHYLNPDIFLDNHVSDGADYQHTITLLTTQHNKLGYSIGNFLSTDFEPILFKKMEEKNWSMCPYVNFETANPDKGWTAFYDPPRFGSGYAALFQTMAFVTETHMLKPYKQRVLSTYALMEVMINEAGKKANIILKKRNESIMQMQQQKQLALGWKIDTTKYDEIIFKGYEAEYKKSEVTNFDRMFYNRNTPYTKKIKYYDYFVEDKLTTKPKAYIIPQGWYNVIDLLKINNVKINQLKKDTVINVEMYKIENYKTLNRAYEKHYKHYDVEISKQTKKINFFKGDYIIYTEQPTCRYLIETLEPEGDDSFFNWNFFDAILQQKEGYSDYRWEDIAANFIKNNPTVKQQLEEKKKADSAFAKNPSAQLNFVYKKSPYYEPVHLRYPVYRLN